jgi:hypothetical protein
VILLIGTNLFYQLLAEDQSGVAGWTVNDTVNFGISTSGLITNNVALETGTYGLNVSVFDVYGNTRYISIRVIVIEEIPTTTATTTTTLPTTTTTDGDVTPFIMTGMLGALGGGLLVGLVVLASRRRAGE